MLRQDVYKRLEETISVPADEGDSCEATSSQQLKWPVATTDGYKLAEALDKGKGPSSMTMECQVGNLKL